MEEIGYNNTTPERSGVPTEPEEPKESAQGATARPVAEIGIGPEGARIIQTVINRQPPGEHQQRILDAYLRHGAPFAVFLLLQDVDPQSPAIADRFEEDYVSSWQRMDELVQDTLEGLGWAQALGEFHLTQGIDPEYLTWDYEQLEVRIRDAYDVVELDGWLHVFYK